MVRYSEENKRGNMIGAERRHYFKWVFREAFSEEVTFKLRPE